MYHNIKKRNKLAIVGFSTTRIYAPYDNVEYDIWVLNDAYKVSDIKRMDAIFVLTDIDFIKANTDSRKYYDWLKNSNVPVILQKQQNDIPTSIEYPYQKIISIYKNHYSLSHPNMYFTNTVTYMIALGVLLGYEEIHLFGVDDVSNMKKYNIGVSDLFAYIKI